MFWRNFELHKNPLGDEFRSLDHKQADSPHLLKGLLKLPEPLVHKWPRFLLALIASTWFYISYYFLIYPTVYSYHGIVLIFISATAPLRCGK